MIQRSRLASYKTEEGSLMLKREKVERMKRNEDSSVDPPGSPSSTTIFTL